MKSALLVAVALRDHVSLMIWPLDKAVSERRNFSVIFSTWAGLPNCGKWLKVNFV